MLLSEVSFYLVEKNKPDGTYWSKNVYEKKQ